MVQSPLGLNRSPESAWQTHLTWRGSDSKIDVHKTYIEYGVFGIYNIFLRQFKAEFLTDFSGKIPEIFLAKLCQIGNHQSSRITPIYIRFVDFRNF